MESGEAAAQRAAEALFVYGTLLDARMRRAVLGAAAEGAARPARLAGYAVRRVRGQDYPTLCPAPGAVAEGLLLEGLGAEAAARIAWLEAIDDFALIPVRVETESGPRAAVAWIHRRAAQVADGPWDFARWQTRPEAELMAEATAELMAARGAIAPSEMPPLWPRFLSRAAARLAARAEPAPTARRRRAGPGDVELIERRVPYVRYFAVEEDRLRFRRFDGGRSEEVLRASFVMGDAVTVLPWDPRSDRVLLIEQFRAGPFARSDPQPWCLEPIAGRRDGLEPWEETARREAREEAGLALGRLHLVGRYYPSPGAVSEFLVSYVGEADLDGAGGIHGLAAEHEDIRVHVLPFEELMALIASGEINTGPTILTALWLARERPRLRRAQGHG